MLLWLKKSQLNIIYSMIFTSILVTKSSIYRYIFTRVAADMGTERGVGCDSFLGTVYLGAVSLYACEIFYKKE